MLPTTGHFKNISCPFYDACICERPYCHFKHSKRETLNDTNLISELVSKAVHKVLNSSKHSQAETNEKSTEAPNNVDGKSIIYNPTPLSELKKFKSNNSSPKENFEKKNRHIPIQYTPEQPRSFRSPIANSSYSSNSLEYNLAESKNAGYSPSSNILSLKTPVSYIPSLIKTLTDNSPTNSSTDISVNSTQTITETNTHQYVPFNLTSEDLQTDTFKAEYNPTKNLSLDDSPTYVEYVPKYNDEFIDDFLNDPNMYEPTEITSSVKDKVDTKSDKKELKSDKSESNKRSDTSHLSEVNKKDKNKSRKDKNSFDSSKSSSSSSKKSSDDNSRSSSKSKHSNKSRHKDKRKDRGKDDEHTNGCDKEHKNNEKVHKCNDKKQKTNDKKQKSNDKKHNSNQRRSRSRDRHRKTVRNSNSSNKREKSVNSNKVSKDTKISEKSKVKNSSDDDRDHSPVLDISDKEDVEVDIEGLSDESDDELEQCKRIFEEYQPPTEIVQSKKQLKPEPVENNSVSSVSKKRVAHEKSSSVSRKPTAKPLAVKTAALVMANRYVQVLSNIEDTNHIVPGGEQLDTLNHITQGFKRSSSKEKSAEDISQDLSYHNPAKIKRIAHVPNVNSLLNAKRKVEEIAKTKSVSKTPIQTISKGSKRVAHIPELTLADVPTVLQSEKSKFSVNVRNRYLLLMVKECVKLYVSKKAAYDRALNEELNCYSKCTAIITYRNSVMLSINRLRKEAESGQPLSPSTGANSTTEFSGKRFYDNIFKWILNEQELVDNGFPRPGASKKGFALFSNANKVFLRIPEDSQLCIRCKKVYKVDCTGFQMFQEDCVYHPSSKITIRGEHKYLCCKESAANSGCCISPNHVFEIRDPSNLSGFVTTLEPDDADDPKCFAVYALDCEMVYTTRGFELARVTVVNHNFDIVYETMVKPAGHILDCNTRYSGLTTEMLEPVTTKITEVQAALLALFNSKTILIGHSLESDLKVLRLIHSTVIDTSVLFPHKMGPPKKRGLRTLASEYLKKIIQNSESGHDSAEDAVTCMELIIYKLKEEIKLR